MVFPTPRKARIKIGRRRSAVTRSITARSWPRSGQTLEPLPERRDLAGQIQEVDGHVPEIDVEVGGRVRGAREEPNREGGALAGRRPGHGLHGDDFGSWAGGR